jgi:hypothetical protein
VARAGFAPHRVLRFAERGGLLAAPITTPFGEFHLASPYNLVYLGTIGAKGVLDLPISIYTQALTGTFAGAALTTPRELTVGG